MTMTAPRTAEQWAVWAKQDRPFVRPARTGAAATLEELALLAGSFAVPAVELAQWIAASKWIATQRPWRCRHAPTDMRDVARQVARHSNVLAKAAGVPWRPIAIPAATTIAARRSDKQRSATVFARWHAAGMPMLVIGIASTFAHLRSAALRVPLTWQERYCDKARDEALVARVLATLEAVCTPRPENQFPSQADVSLPTQRNI